MSFFIDYRIAKLEYEKTYDPVESIKIVESKKNILNFSEFINEKKIY